MKRVGAYLSLPEQPPRPTMDDGAGGKLLSFEGAKVGWPRKTRQQQHQPAKPATSDASLVRRWSLVAAPAKAYKVNASPQGEQW